jgi:hypothetical protein
MLNNKVECALNELTNALFSAYDAIERTIDESGGVFRFSKGFKEDLCAKPFVYVNDRDGFVTVSELCLRKSEFSGGRYVYATSYDDGMKRTILIDHSDAENIISILRSMKLYV